MRLYRHAHQPVSITAAHRGLSEDIRHRQRRYALTMGIRTVCVILAIVLWQVDRIAAVIAIVAGGVLPYIAVVFANAGHERGEEPFDSRYTPGPPPGLGPGVPPQSTGERGNGRAHGDRRDRPDDDRPGDAA